MATDLNENREGWTNAAQRIKLEPERVINDIGFLEAMKSRDSGVAVGFSQH
jgi:hypothetical protein